MDKELVKILSDLQTKLLEAQKNDIVPSNDDTIHDLVNSCQRMITNELED